MLSLDTSSVQMGNLSSRLIYPHQLISLCEWIERRTNL